MRLGVTTMMIRANVIPLALLLTLTGCVPTPEPPPEGSPGPSVTAPTPSPTVSASPAAPALKLPGSCAELVPLATVHAEFAPSFESIDLLPGWGGPVAQDFASRGGLVCVWGIPNSDAGALNLYVAERATATDEQQVDTWRSAGYSECPPFLDACYYQFESNEVGEFWTVHVLVEGYEMSIQATAETINPLLVAARAAATTMGYV